MTFNDTGRRLIAAGVCSLCWSGAQASPALDAALRKAQAEGPRNQVLNHLQAATIAFADGEQQAAEASIDRALLGIGAVYGNNAQAARARSLWVEEGAKDFKGEPYERAMAYYYRGLFDLIAGDYENARASFKSGALQDAFAEEGQNREDFALMLLLQGWASQLAGATVLRDEAWAELKTLRPDYVLPGLNDRVLVIAETGKSPRKLADGIGHNLLVYRRGKRFTEQRVRVEVGGQTVQAYPMEDIYWQASTRGGRPVDGILEGKVRFRNTADAVGSTLTTVGNTAAQYSPVFSSGSTSGAFAAVSAVGALTMAVGAGAKAQADTRYWNNLPDTVHVLTLADADQAHSLRFEFLDAAGAPVPGLNAAPQIHIDANGNGLVWIRSRAPTEPN